jgi:hypothetical protein
VKIEQVLIRDLKVCEQEMEEVALTRLGVQVCNGKV